jgi:polar amino acid transport system permease protein
MAFGPDGSWLDVGQIGAGAVALANGAVVTVELIAVTAVLGGMLSIAGAAGRRSSLAWCRAAVAGYVELIRNTPFIVQLFFVFFGLPTLGLHLGAMAAAILAMTVNMSAYGTEIMRAGLDAVAPGQREAGRALGLRGWAIFARIVLPQALRAVFPALASQIVITMLESAVVSQIAVRDLTYEADLIQSRNFLSFQTYAIVTGIYLALAILLRRVLGLGGRAALGPIPPGRATR